MSSQKATLKESYDIAFQFSEWTAHDREDDVDDVAVTEITRTQKRVQTDRQTDRPTDRQTDGNE
ncbi:unnamed protein product [Callosobruchus maculatus]|uniref:Uncharacterized protein n=1 Tax=Callosobruchus maculatus TaxID=64391 RepID=A0A653DTG3_CALMS|nr:unnamed protein product [Callosobruchus maculatus]